MKPEDLLFVDQSYVLNVTSDFYRDALEAMSKLNTWKHVPDREKEHVFYNPIFTTTVEKDIETLQDITLKPFYGNKSLNKLATYGDLLHANRTLTDPKLRAAIKENWNP